MRPSDPQIEHFSVSYLFNSQSSGPMVVELPIISYPQVDSESTRSETMAEQPQRDSCVPFGFISTKFRLFPCRSPNLNAVRFVNLKAVDRKLGRPAYAVTISFLSNCPITHRF